MSRSLPEWIGRDDDDPVPPRVRLRVWERKGGICHRCGRKISAGERWTCEHVKALINHPGMNRESNLDITCDWCLPGKNAEDVAEKSFTYRRRLSHAGLKHERSGRGFLTNKSGPFKRKFDGTLVRRHP